MLLRAETDSQADLVCNTVQPATYWNGDSKGYIRESKQRREEPAKDGANE